MYDCIRFVKWGWTTEGRAPVTREHQFQRWETSKNQNNSILFPFVCVEWIWKVKVNENIFKCHFAISIQLVRRRLTAIHTLKRRKITNIIYFCSANWNCYRRWLQWLLNSSTKKQNKKTWCLIKAIINGLIEFQHSIKINKHQFSADHL